MKNIILYDNNGNKTLEFKFNNPRFEYNDHMQWVTLFATGRTFTLKDISFLAYDEEIKTNTLIPDFGDLMHTEINEAYNETGKLVIVFTSTGFPVKMFCGDKISFMGDNKITHLQIDEKDLWLFGMGFLILSKNK